MSSLEASISGTNALEKSGSLSFSLILTKQACSRTHHIQLHHWIHPCKSRAFTKASSTLTFVQTSEYHLNTILQDRLHVLLRFQMSFCQSGLHMANERVWRSAECTAPCMYVNDLEGAELWSSTNKQTK